MLPQEYLSDIAKGVDRPVNEASLRVEGAEVIVQPGQVGRKLDVPAGLAALFVGCFIGLLVLNHRLVSTMDTLPGPLANLATPAMPPAAGPGVSGTDLPTPGSTASVEDSSTASAEGNPPGATGDATSPTTKVDPNGTDPLPD